MFLSWIHSKGAARSGSAKNECGSTTLLKKDTPFHPTLISSARVKHKSKINFTGMQNDSLQPKLKIVQNLTSQVELWIQIHIRNTDPDPHMHRKILLKLKTL